MHSGTCVSHVPWCMPGSLTKGFLWIRWQGKRSRHSRLMRNPQFCVSFERPIAMLFNCSMRSLNSYVLDVSIWTYCETSLCFKGLDGIIYYIYPCQAPYWWLTPSKYVFAVFFRGCVSERVVSSFCWITASTLCQFWSTPTPASPFTRKRKT